jgi:septation ring formation regulator EzrA
MTEEERERLLEFILQSQANSEVRLQKLEEMHLKLEESHQKSDARMSRLEKAFVTSFNIVTEIAEAQKSLTAEVKELRAAQAETAEKLDIFINVLERYISGEGNGRPRRTE